jgi:YggT family protein
MGIVFGLVYIALLLFFVTLIIRLVFDWVQMFAREWLRRLIPPLRLGGITLDLGFLLLFIAVSVAMGITKSFA